jgi:hypothetical protein
MPDEIRPLCQWNAMSFQRIGGIVEQAQFDAFGVL